jgi:hypothetical protein
MDRRTFIQAAAIVATTPILANVMSLTASAKSTPAMEIHPAGDAGVERPIEFRVRSWQENAYTVPARNTAFSMERTGIDRNSDHVLITVNQAWRTAWR